MKKALIFTAILAVALPSCKTTEANYRAAYEATRASQTDADADDDGNDGIDENVRRMLNLDKKQRQYVQIVGSDTLNITDVFALINDNQVIDYVPEYSVVVNAFSQQFNAQALLKRLQEAGFDGAYIFHSSTPDYYVAAGGSDNAGDIPTLLQRLDAAGNPGSRRGFPAVVRVPRWK